MDDRIKRIGLGVSAGLWLSFFVNELAREGFSYEAFLGALAAYGAWIWLELQPARVPMVERLPPESMAPQLSAHDLKLARLLLVLSRNEFLALLRDHDFGNSIHSSYVERLHEFVDKIERKVYFFQDISAKDYFDKFAGALQSFSRKLVECGRTTGADHQLITTKPAALMDDEMRHRWRTEVQELNELATEAYRCLDQLVDYLVEKFPAVADELIPPLG